MTAHEKLVAFCEAKLEVASDEEYERLRAGAPDVPDLRDPERKVGTIFTIEGVNYKVPAPPDPLHAEWNELRVAAQQESSTE